MTLRSLILLRHGETEWNAGHRLQGHRNIALNAVGRRQAAEAAPSIAALRPQLAIASDLDRAWVTAQEAVRPLGLAVRQDPRLRETALGKWEGVTWQDAERDWPDEWAAWRSTSAHTRPPGGESRWEVASRAAAVVAELDTAVLDTAVLDTAVLDLAPHDTAAPDTADAEVQRVLLVAHGGTIAGLTGRLLGLPDEFWSSLVGIGNCHWVVLHRVPDGRWRLHTYNAGLGAVVVTGSADSDDVAGT